MVDNFLPKPTISMPQPKADEPLAQSAPVSVTPPPGVQIPPPPPVRPLNMPPAPMSTALPGLGNQSGLGAQPQAAMPVQPAQPVTTVNSPTGGGGKGPVFARVQKSPMKFLPIILGGLLFLAVIIFALLRFMGGSSSGGSVSIEPDNVSGGAKPVTQTPSKQTILTYWGLWEPDEALAAALDEFGTQNPGVIVEYKKQSPQEYRERLQSAIAAGNGPDLFRFHASWTPMLRAELDPMPSSVMSKSEFAQTFYPVASQQLTYNNQIVGVPLMYDGLSLYYNKQAFKTANVAVPASWADLKTAAKTLTIKSGEQVERAGIALGTASNVEHFSDVLGLLMLQNGADLTNPSSKEAEQALIFYTDFVTKLGAWDETMPSSTIAFARGDVAMMFAPSWRAHEVMALNPQLEFGIVPAPKLTEARLAWASYWAEGVNSQSKNKDLAWKLLKYLSSAEIQQQLYSTQSKLRSFGEPYSRVELADKLIDDSFVGAYLEDAPVATGWYLNSATHDNGLNDQLISYYEDAVNMVLAGEDVSVALEPVVNGTSQILRQYGVAR